MKAFQERRGLRLPGRGGEPWGESLSPCPAPHTKARKAEAPLPSREEAHAPWSWSHQGAHSFLKPTPGNKEGGEAKEGARRSRAPERRSPFHAPSPCCPPANGTHSWYIRVVFQASQSPKPRRHWWKEAQDHAQWGSEVGCSRPHRQGPELDSLLLGTFLLLPEGTLRTSGRVPASCCPLGGRAPQVGIGGTF